MDATDRGGPIQGSRSGPRCRVAHPPSLVWLRFEASLRSQPHVAAMAESTPPPWSVQRQRLAGRSRRTSVCDILGMGARPAEPDPACPSHPHHQTGAPDPFRPALRFLHDRPTRQPGKGCVSLASVFWQNVEGRNVGTSWDSHNCHGLDLKLRLKPVDDRDISARLDIPGPPGSIACSGPHASHRGSPVGLTSPVAATTDSLGRPTGRFESQGLGQKRAVEASRTTGHLPERLRKRPAI